MTTESSSTARLSCTSVPPARRVPSMIDDVRAGLLSPPRWLPPKYFYDETGSLLFEAICDTPEYYPSRTEAALLAEHAGEIMALAAPRHLLELGSGSSRKTRLLLDAWPAPAGTYWPFDVCAEMVASSGRALIDDYPDLVVRGLEGDYHGGLSCLPLPAEGRRLVAFLGGTIGNFHPGEAEAMLGEIADLLRDGDHVLIGFDRVKDPAVLEAAYDDAAGMTARFNRNVLSVLNRSLDADFPVDAYRHRSVYDPELQRVEMRLRADHAHRVTFGQLDTAIDMAAGEEILTEISRKFTPSSFGDLLAAAGLAETAHFEAEGGMYSLVLAVRR